MIQLYQPEIKMRRIAYLSLLLCDRVSSYGPSQ